MQDEGVGEAGSEIVDPVRIIAIQFGKLFWYDFNGKILKLQWKGNNLLLERGAK